MWYSSQVFKGDQSGRTIGFPTINLDPSVIPQHMQQGVYAAIVKHQGKQYIGALYLGPRLVVGETKTVLEIHLLDFDKEIYGENVSFQIKDFVRGILDFASFDEMKQQLQKDITAIQRLG